MKKYNITVNGTTYEVEVEEVAASTQSAPVAAETANTKSSQTDGPAGEQTDEASTSNARTEQSKAAASADSNSSSDSQKKQTATAAPAGGGDKTVTAPMPGTVLEIRISEGQQVKQGDVLMILEAMKMENEIAAPADGTVAQITAVKGSSVSAGDVLATLK